MFTPCSPSARTSRSRRRCENGRACLPAGFTRRFQTTRRSRGNRATPHSASANRPSTTSVRTSPVRKNIIGASRSRRNCGRFSTVTALNTIPITCWIDASIAPCGGSPSYCVRNHGLAPVATLSRPPGSAAPAMPPRRYRTDSRGPTLPAQFCHPSAVCPSSAAGTSSLSVGNALPNQSPLPQVR